jgi:hypothetical protein
MQVLMQLLLTAPIVPPCSAQITRTHYLLEAARKKLLTSPMPLLLRITTFLRLSCTAVEAPGMFYQLMQALFNHDTEWWKTCDITPAGTVQSSDPEIQILLAIAQPLHFVPEL